MRTEPGTQRFIALLREWISARSVREGVALAVFFVGLAVIAVAIHGYHPYSEDAAIYVPAIKKQLDPTLYPHEGEFFLALTRFSFFSSWVATSIRWTHVSLETGLLAWHIGTLALLLAAAWRLCILCFRDRRLAVYGTVLMTSVLTLPVAGTSLLITDPYLTGRSLSTPALLLAVCFVLEERFLPALLSFLVGLLVHPLMAVYAGLFVLALLAIKKRYWGLIGLAAVCAAMGLIVVGHMERFVHVSSSYRAAILTRSYFFLSRWEWYEKFGLIAPLALFAWIGWKKSPSSNVEWISKTVVVCGVGCVLIEVLLTYDSSLIALTRYQPLRIFQIIYILLFLIVVNLGIASIPKHRTLALALTVIAASVAMFAAERLSFPASPHMEAPFTDQKTPWIDAFDWVRVHTPKDAVFALDPNYMDLPREDHHGFRAYAERASLADHTKDGGVAAIFPELADTWIKDTAATSKLSGSSNDAEIAALEQRGATWMIRSGVPNSGLICPYSNAAVAVCELPPNASLAVRTSMAGTRDDSSKTTSSDAVKAISK